ncbi:MAG: hypothetical protein DSZ35_06445 [Verrucomicrobia bacterium]|nr:MAG: hypothetical protein DSZ35_06445 [Verrucomicrobiota bacterium]
MNNRPSLPVTIAGVLPPKSGFKLKTNAKTTVVLSAFLLAGWACAPTVSAEKARFYSSKGGAAFKSRAKDIRSWVGRSSLDGAKSLSGVGTALYPGSASSMDRATSKRLLELFDKKKNWMFQDLGGDDKTGDMVEEWSRENDLLGGEDGGRQNSFFKSRGVVQDFLRSDEKEKRPRKKSRRRGQLERLPGEDEEEDLTESEFELNPDEFKEDGRKKESSLFLARSPFAAKTALADFSPFSRKSTKSTDPFKTLGNRAGQNGGRPEASQALGQSGAVGHGGFFQQQKKSGANFFSNKNYFDAKPGGSSKGALGLDPMSFSRGMAPKPSTPVTGVGVGGMSAGFKLPPGLTSPASANNPFSSAFASPPSAARQELPLLFQSRDRRQPAIRSGLLNQKPGTSANKPQRGF